jgi:hypothetical protein
MSLCAMSQKKHKKSEFKKFQDTTNIRIISSYEIHPYISKLPTPNYFLFASEANPFKGFRIEAKPNFNKADSLIINIHAYQVHWLNDSTMIVLPKKSANIKEE